MAVTIKDVAKKANVSISTVSRVINSSKPVSDDIKKRVFEVIEELGYMPNPVARNLVMKKTKLIGVMVPDISSAFVGELLNAVEEIAKTYSYDIILCNSYGNIKQEERYFSLFASKQVEGIIFMTRKVTDIHKRILKSMKIPVVMINRKAFGLDAFSVSVDQEKSTYDMVKYLISQGHKQIDLIRSGDDNETFGIDQKLGYKKALEESCLTYDATRIHNGGFSLEKAYNIVNDLIVRRKMPTAFFAATDDMAIGVINAAIDNGLKVPKDLSVAGAYNSRIANIYRPKLTTIKHPIYDIGAIAVRMIIKQIDGHETKERMIIMPHEIIVRESTKKYKYK